MPKYRMYYPSPDLNFEKLQELLMLMNQFGFADGDQLDAIELLMGRIYPVENKQILVRDGSMDEEDDSENFAAPATEIFDLVDNKDQFVQDYRNVIASILWPDTHGYDFDELVEQITRGR